MAGSFGALSAPLSSLIAQRQAIEVAGQNIANANTAGYTRQRVDTASVEAPRPTLFATGTQVGQGTSARGIVRMSDAFLDAQLRTQTAKASSLSVSADTYSKLEAVVAEPSDTALSTSFSDLWSAFSDVANRPDDTAARNVLLQKANTLVGGISAGYTQISDLYSTVRDQVSNTVDEVNQKATSVADLNGRIRDIVNAGGNANELMDQRSQAITQLAGLVGAVARDNGDGTTDVFVAGNPLVAGGVANQLKVSGSATLGSAASDPVTVTWARDGLVVGADGGTLAGQLSAVAAGGSLTTAADAYNQIATNLASTVNALHSTGYDRSTPPVTGTDFFALTAGAPPAVGLHVALTDASQIAVAASGAGALDGSVASAIAKAGAATGGPSAAWSAFVVDTGVKSATASQRSGIAESARANAEAAQQSSASVDVDEETSNMIVLQRAYQGAARVLTTIDEMLDTLINRTGKVGL